MNEQRERGAALITVMFIFMIAALIAMGMLSRQRLDIERTGTLLAQAQGYQYAFGAEELARQVLLADAGLMPGIDYPGQRWAHLGQGLPTENGTIQISIEDMQGRFNLNVIIDSQAEKDRFHELVKKLALREDVAQIIINALGTTNAPHMLIDSTELKSIEGLLPEEVAALLPYVTALPERVGMLNINTAPEKVLKSYEPDENAYERFMKAFAKKGYLSEAELNGIGMNTKGMTVGSHYFRITSQVQVAGHRIMLASNLVRDSDLLGKVHIRVTSRDNNGGW